MGLLKGGRDQLIEVTVKCREQINTKFVWAKTPNYEN